MFDGKLRIEKEFQRQEMNIRQFELYREDVRDLVNLTVVKMDKYLIVNLLQFGFCITLLTEGRAEEQQGAESPPWLLWLTQMCNAGAFVYYLLSVWLAVHASIAAHSFGVRLLTQIVRLPLPSEEQLDAARSTSEEFEGESLGYWFRVPLWRAQLRKLNAAMANVNARDDDTMSEAGDSVVPEDFGSPVALLHHVRLFRQLQANWQSYDAYARVCMALGTSQLLHAICYYCMGMLVAAGDVVWPAVSSTILFVGCGWILTRLDLYLSRRRVVAAGVLLATPPLLGTISITCERGHYAFMRNKFYMELWKYLMPIAYTLHLLWIIFTIWVAKANYLNQVALPTKFRSVLYLDVFGWLTDAGQDSNTYGEGIEGGDAGRRFDFTLASRRAQMRDLPPSLRELFTSECQVLHATISQDIKRWESRKIEPHLEDNVWAKKMIRALRGRFDEVSRHNSEVLGLPPIAVEGTSVPDLRASDNHWQSGSLSDLDRSSSAGSRGDRPETDPSAPQVWLKLEWDSQGSPIEYFYCLELDETLWELPEAPNSRISDLSTLEQHIITLDEKGSLLKSCDQGRQAQHVPSSPRFGTSSLTVAPEAGAAPRSPQHRGQDRPEEGERYLSHAPEVGSSFYPAQSREQQLIPRAQQEMAYKLPGKIPWHSVLIGTFIIIILWIMAIYWLIGNIVSGYSHEFEPVEYFLNSRPISWLDRPELVYAGPWPHAFFKPQGIACDPSMGSAVLLAEQYGIHELRLPATAERIWLPLPGRSPKVLGEARIQSALGDCLSKAPGFQGRGLRSVGLKCHARSNLSASNAVAANCDAVLLGMDGKSLLRCGNNSGVAEASRHRTLGGQSWRVLAAAESGAYWALADEGVVRLQQRDGAPWELVPKLELPEASMAANLTSLFVLGNRFLVGLERGGTMHAWPLDGRPSRSWPMAGRMNVDWTSACAMSERDLLLFGEGRRGSGLSPGIYRVDMPWELVMNAFPAPS